MSHLFVDAICPPTLPHHLHAVFSPTALVSHRPPQPRIHRTARQLAQPQATCNVTSAVSLLRVASHCNISAISNGMLYVPVFMSASRVQAGNLPVQERFWAAIGRDKNRRGYDEDELQIRDSGEGGSWGCSGNEQDTPPRSSRRGGRRTSRSARRATDIHRRRHGQGEDIAGTFAKRYALLSLSRNAEMKRKLILRVQISPPAGRGRAPITVLERMGMQTYGVACVIWRTSQPAYPSEMQSAGSHVTRLRQLIVASPGAWRQPVQLHKQDYHPPQAKQ
ncbi:hypothetical protein K438DRAFT_1770049 [Mycena galopus ATCC 62051]|nr:hypothetical protein K438DRAFT_1770049 [Mycena galopus ATCC 62051]